MNIKIKKYIESRRNNDNIILINSDSGVISRADKIGQLHQLDLLEIGNKHHKFDDPISFKVLVIISICLNVYFIGFV